MRPANETPGDSERERLALAGKRRRGVPVLPLLPTRATN